MKRLMTFVTVASLAAVLVGCGNDAKTAKNDKKPLVVVTEATFPPYEYRTGNDITGIDIDICQAVAKKLGRELKAEDTKFDSVLAHVATRKADAAASGITITEDRKKNVLFTDPYIAAYQVISVMKGSKIKSAADLNANVRIGVQASTTGCLYVRKHINTDKSTRNVQEYDNAPLAIAAMKAGKVDACVLDEGPTRALAAQNEGNVVILETPLTKEEYAIALNKNDTELCKAFNEVIADLKKSGKLDLIIKFHKEKCNMLDK